MRELKLRYLIDLVSNIGPKAAADAKAMQQAQAVLKGAITGTNDKFTDQAKLAALAGKNVGTLQEIITGATNKFVGLERALQSVGRDSSIERQIGYMRRLADSIDGVERRMSSLASRAMAPLGAVGRGMLKAGDAALAVGAIGGAAAWGAGKVLGPALRNFTSLEDAQTALRVALMRKGGKIDPAYPAIAKVANELGIQLPGTPTDYFSAAVELAGQGVAPSAIAGGALKSAAQMGVLLHMNRADAAHTIARIREAYGAHDDQLGEVSDIVQRHKFAFGVTPEGVREAASYSGSMLATLGLRDMKYLSRVLTLQGMAQQAGLGDSQFGSNFAMMLTMLSKGPLLIEEAKKGMKADVRKRLDEANVKFRFFDDQGHLKTIGGDPIAAIMQELSKFKILREKGGEEAASEAASAMFGQQGVRPAMIMGELGLEGYMAARKKVEEQPNIEERILEASTALSWKMETLSGNVQNLTAVMADGIGKWLKGPADRAANIAGNLTGWASEHPAVGSAALLGAAGTAAALGGIGARSGLRMLGMHGAAARVMPALGRAGIWGAATWGGWELGNWLGDMYVDSVRDQMRSRQGVTLSADSMARLGLGPISGAAPIQNLLNITAPGIDPLAVPIGSKSEIKIGEGRLAIDVHVLDDRVTAIPRVQQPMSLLRIDPGRTNPGGF